MSFQIVKRQDKIADINSKLKELIDLFVKNYLSDNSKIAYEGDIKRFLLFCQTKGYSFNHPSEIRSSHLQEFRDWLINERQLETNTVLRYMVSVRQLLEYCQKENIIERNPLLNVRMPRANTLSKTQAFTDEEVRRILSIPNKSTLVGALHYAVLVVLFYLGVRKGELIKMKWKDIKEEGIHTVIVIHGKGSKDRIIPLSPIIKEAINNYKSITEVTDPDDYIFKPTRNNYSKITNKSLDPTTINYIISFYVYKAGITKQVSPHSCRASAISNLLDNKVSIRDVAVLVGHSSIQTTSIYDKRKNDLNQSAAYKIHY